MKRALLAVILLVSALAQAQTFPVNNLQVNGTSAFTGAATFSTGLALSNLVQTAANTVLANATGSTASVAAFAMPGCSAATNALTWTTSAGFTCNSAINAATLGGATFGAPGPIGSTTASTGAFTTLATSGATTHSALVTVQNGGTPPGAGAAINAYDTGTIAPYTTPGFNFFQTEAYAAGSGNFHNGMVVQENRTGGSGNRNAFYAIINSSTAAAGEFVVGAQLQGNITAGSGSAFGANPYVQVLSGAAASAEAVAAENDTDIRATVNRKVGLQVIDVATSTAGGSTYDAGILIGKQVGGKGYGTGIQFGLSTTGGLQSGSSLITAPYAFTVATGIDISALTITGNAFKSPGYTLTGAGAVTAASIAATGTGSMPLYGTAGAAFNAPHQVIGSVSLSAGSATVTLSGAAVYSSISSYTCTANDTTAANSVKVTANSGTSFTFTGTGTDGITFVCVGD